MTHGDFNNHDLMEIRFCCSSSIVNRQTQLFFYMRIRQTCENQKSLLNQLTCKLLYISISIDHLFVIDFKIIISKFKCYYARMQMYADCWRMQIQQFDTENVTKLIGISLIFGYVGIFGEYYLLCKTTDALPSVTSSDCRINGKIATWQVQIDFDFFDRNSIRINKTISGNFEL